jgi:T5SS/PEP-CTERM-associated repeat protein
MKMKRRGYPRIVWATAAMAALGATNAWAGIASDGDVTPADPSVWTASTNGIVGNTSTGTVTVSAGSALVSSSCYLGYSPGATGAVTIDGAGSTWNTGNYLYVGYSGTGTLNITDGGQVTNALYETFVGHDAGSIGSVTVDGAGSAWTGLGDIQVGNFGNGMLTISNGGSVGCYDANIGFTGTAGAATATATVSGPGSIWYCADLIGIGGGGVGSLLINDGGNVSSPSVYLGAAPGAAGKATVDGAGSTMNIGLQMELGGAGATGVLMISNGGKVSGNGGGTLGFGTESTGTIIVDGAGSSWAGSGTIYIGNYGTGILHISQGGNASASDVYLGFFAGSAGTATVDGSGSMWDVNGTFYVGSSGIGILNITHGGYVTSGDSYLGFNAGSTGTATVDGSGSRWDTHHLYLGSSGAGLMSIVNGGQVTAEDVSIGSGSILTMNIGDGSALTLNPFGIGNGGIIRLRAVPGLAAGNYTPITAQTWSGSGAVEALGGRWNSTAHTFIVSAAADANAGTPVGIDLSQTQRVVVTDPTAGKKVEAAFQAASATNLTFTATTLTDPQIASLESELPQGDPILAGWTFTADGYIAGDPVFLSLELGSGLSGDLAVWHYDGATWTPYAASDLSYDGEYANFTVTGFSGYAVTAAVPEPGAIVLLLAGVGLGARRRRHARA